jgi:predicted TIM-barrel fold metal-dependent hydrolase
VHINQTAGRGSSCRFESPQVAQDCARALLAAAEPERLLWGSDWPFAAFEDRMRYDYAIASFKE